MSDDDPDVTPPDLPGDAIDEETDEDVEIEDASEPDAEAAAADGLDGIVEIEALDFDDGPHAPDEPDETPAPDAEFIEFVDAVDAIEESEPPDEGGPTAERQGPPPPRHAVDTIDVEDEDDDELVDPVGLLGELPWEPSEPLKVVFAGGKGGTGRSLIAANLGLYLSRLGREVVVADLDPSGSNLHTFLGLEPLLPSPGALLRAPGPPRLEQVGTTRLRLCRPPWPMGAGDDPLRAEALDAALSQGADVVILDLGTQADPLTLDTFLSADAGIVVVLPEPVAIERAYAFLRSALYRRLLHGSDEPAIVARALLAADQVGQLDTPADLVAALSGVHADAAAAIRARVLSFTPRMLINMCRSRADREMAPGLVSALRRRWGIGAIPLGGVEYDEVAWEATRRRRAVMVEYPASALAGHIERLARRLLATMGKELRV